MKAIFWSLAAALIASWSLGQPLPAASPMPARLKRADSFLGVHFDFHARMIDHEIGTRTTREMIENIINLVHPDYIQVDCKGHFGVSSYPTKVGNPAPDISGDPLRVWREVTAEHGVALYVHYSGVADDRAIELHPEWAAVDAEGKPSPRSTSRFSSYVDELMLPQLREVAGYGVDGAWIDGDCWAALPDYSEPALRAFRTATGITTIPRKSSDPHWLEFMNFHREAFRQYLRHYTSELHRLAPGFQVASNWSFSDHMPEAVSADVDFLSGDFSTQNAVNSARFTARCFEGRGRPWDLMAWSWVQVRTDGPAGTVRAPGGDQKSVVQMEQEAAIVLARGGGFESYFFQQADGSIYDWQMPAMGAVAQFCRERQAICHGAVAVPQVALLYSTTSHYRQSPRLFAPVSPTVTAVRGVLQSLLDSQLSVEVVNEDQLKGRMAKWPVIVLPETEYLEPDFRAELLAYARNGGSLVVIGPRCAALFRDEISFGPTSLPAGPITAHLGFDGRIAVMLTEWKPVALAAPAQPFGRLYFHDNPRSMPDPQRGAFGPAGSVTAFGRGRIAAAYVNLGERYLNSRTTVARDYLQALVQEVFPQPAVRVTGSRAVDVSLMRQGNRIAVNLVNTAGPHENPSICVFDEIPSVGPLTVNVRTGQRPARVLLEPGARSLDYDYANGVVTVHIPRLDVHSVVVVDP